VTLTLPYDYHVHTRYSPDSDASMDDMVRRAVELGLDEIMFTEHQEYHPREGEQCRLRADAWFADIARLNERYRGRLVIRAGLELGQPHLYAAEARALIDAHPFDAISGSLHYVGDRNIFGREYFAERTIEQAYGDYFAELPRMAAAGGFDILAHIDGVKRDGVRYYRRYDIRVYESQVRETFRGLIANGIALELNTSGIRRVSELHPPLVALRWYREMGGELITVGSDAHAPRHIAEAFPLALDLAREAGFTRLAAFRLRKIDWIAI
jgi:histidinol-phosphatase (PHP family)